MTAAEPSAPAGAHSITEQQARPVQARECEVASLSIRA